MFLRLLYVGSMVVTLLIRLTVFLENYNEMKHNERERAEGEHDSDSEDDYRA